MADSDISDIPISGS